MLAIIRIVQDTDGGTARREAGGWTTRARYQIRRFRNRTTGVCSVTDGSIHAYLTYGLSILPSEHIATYKRRVLGGVLRVVLGGIKATNTKHHQQPSSALWLRFGAWLHKPSQAVKLTSYRGLSFFPGCVQWCVCVWRWALMWHATGLLGILVGEFFVPGCFGLRAGLHTNVHETDWESLLAVNAE